MSRGLLPRLVESISVVSLYVPSVLSDWRPQVHNGGNHKEGGTLIPDWHEGELLRRAAQPEINNLVLSKLPTLLDKYSPWTKSLSARTLFLCTVYLNRIFIWAEELKHNLLKGF